MTTIQAQVNPRLLTKASRLFTGTVAGRIIEILQNARKLTIRSHGHQVTLAPAAWTGRPVAVVDDPRGLPASGPGIPAGVGTQLEFPDEPWTAHLVMSRAVFSGLDVTLDEELCPQESFLTGRATPHPELGCRIQVVPSTTITQWHRNAALGPSCGENVLVNFHGQVVTFSYRPVSQHDLHFLVDMTGEPTGIRLMLPARTCLVENDALKQLKAALEREAFLYLQRQGRHRLSYKEYLRARELGIELPESEPVYRVGLLHTDMGPEPMEVLMPQGHALAHCYRLVDTKDREDTDEANVHLLAALGRFPTPFVPVEINPAYDGYSWAKLPTIRKVTVSVGKTLQESWVNGERLVCVDVISITVRGSDGQTFRSAVCLAVKPARPGRVENWFSDSVVYVTPAAQQQLTHQDLWFHLGGFSDDGDTYDTQEFAVQQELDEFWLRLVGPYETLRENLQAAAKDLPKGWRQVTLCADGQITVRQANGRDKVLAAPHPEGKPEQGSKAGAAKGQKGGAS